MARKKDIQTLNIMQLFEQIIDITAGKELQPTSITQARPYLRVIGGRLSLNETEALMLSACVNLCCNGSADVGDFAKHFGCKNIRIQTHWADLLSLEKKRFVVKKQEYNGEVSFAMPPSVLNALRENTVPTPPVMEGLSILDWFDMLGSLLYAKDKGQLSYDGLTDELDRLITSNPTLPVTQRIRFYGIDSVNATTVLFLAMLHLYVQNADDHVMQHDLEDYYENDHGGRATLRHEMRSLELGVHLLQYYRLVEFSCSDGQVDSNAWKLTDKAKREFLEGLNYCKTKNAGLLQADTIVEKSLYFAPRVEKQVRQLADLLRPERFVAVQKRLEEHGMRRGFACIFYGSPGTGKTETVYQLARRTGRAIKMVDVPNLRSKWVGETEKNIKAVFDDYRQLCLVSDVAPILLFNEADAVLCKRNEGAVSGVDKMENAMQNIILQEMESLEGILVATTNLTGNLDAAFERRFLYKIEFPKPTAAESCHIWHSLLPELTEAEALTLATDYSFSGGQIENIARKHIVDAILADEDYAGEGAREHLLSAIREACAAEKFHGGKTKVLGFA